MSLRISSLHLHDMLMQDLRTNQSRMNSLQHQLATGKRINAPSDDPINIGRALAIGGQVSDIEGYLETIADSREILDATDDSLDSVHGSLRKFRDLMLRGMSGNATQEDRDAIAVELAQVKESMRHALNASHGDRYLFAGTATTTVPFPAPGNGFSGNSQTVLRQIGQNTTIDVNVAGDAVVGSTTGATLDLMSMFDLVDATITRLTSGVPADIVELQTDGIPAIDAMIDNVSSVRASVGSRLQRVEAAEQVLLDSKQRLTDTKSRIEDADMAEVMIEFQSANTLYQASLAAGARMMQTSLLDFL